MCRVFREVKYGCGIYGAVMLFRGGRTNPTPC